MCWCASIFHDCMYVFVSVCIIRLHPDRACAFFLLGCVPYVRLMCAILKSRLNFTLQSCPIHRRTCFACTGFGAKDDGDSCVMGSDESVTVNHGPRRAAMVASRSVPIEGPSTPIRYRPAVAERPLKRFRSL